MSYNIPPSGKAKIYSGIRKIEDVLKTLPKFDPRYARIQEGLRDIWQGEWMNEEQLKALYRLGWREGEWLTWLPDDFDDEY